MSDASIVSVYCKKTKPRPKKGEHIILDGLGGKSTIREVCGSCNGRLRRSPYEEYLRKSHAARWRYFDPLVLRGEVGAVQFLQFEWGYLDGRLGMTVLQKLCPRR